MKYNNFRAFDKHLSDAAPNHFSDLYLILSKDNFNRKQAADAVISALTIQEVSPFDASTEPFGKFIEELTSLSFFSKKRIILVQHLDKAPKPFLEKLEIQLSKPHPGIVMILTAVSLNANTKLYKQIEKAGIIYEQPEEKPWEKEKTAQEWVVTKAAHSRKSISREAAMTLVKQAGTDTGILYQELEKLILYTGNQTEITVKDIESICVAVNTDSVWQLGEAIFKRDRLTALRISKGLMDDGLAFLALLRMLRNQFETGFQISTLLSESGSSAEITRLYPYMKGAILDKNIQQAKNFGIQKYKQGILAIDEAELKAKNSGIDEEILNELLIAKLTRD